MPAQTNGDTVIERIDIGNYRSCVNATFRLQPDLSVLIGPNGCGKTTLLSACRLIRQLTEARSMFRNSESIALTAAVDPTMIKAVFRVLDKKVVLDAKLQINTDESNSDDIAVSDERWHAKDFTGNNKKIRLPLWLARFVRGRPPAHGVDQVEGFHFAQHAMAGRLGKLANIPESIVDPLVAIAAFSADIRYYSASQFTDPTKCPVSFEIEKQGQRASHLRGHSKALYDMYLEYTNKSSSKYDVFFGVVGPSGLGLVDSVEFEEVLTSSTEYSVLSGGRVRPKKREKVLVIPRFRIGGNDLSPSQLSEGTFKTLVLLFYLLTDRSSMLLIEEPEVCVHHGLLSSIIEIVKACSLEKQIVLSTHSDFVLDLLDPRHVYLVSKSQEAGTEVAQIEESMSAKDFRALKAYLATEGNLGEYWRGGGID